MRSFCLDCSNYIADGVAHNCQVLMADGFVHIGKPKSKSMKQLIKEELKKKKFRPYRAGHGKGWG